MIKTRIGVVTGSRAEYGLLYGIMRELQAAPEMELQVIVTGMHLCGEFGLTYRTIVEDGFEIAEKVEMLLASDTPVGAVKSVGLGMIGFADTLQRLRPDCIVVLGDRFEIWAAAAAAYMAQIPIIHIGGGDVTEGAFDEGIRHGITKMARLHFVTNELSRERVCQLGENPAHVVNVGHPGIERILHMPLLNREEVQRKLGFRLRARNVLVTYHPETLGGKEAEADMEQLLEALDRLGDGTGILMTRPNADPGGRQLARLLEAFAHRREHVGLYTTLGQLLYFSTARYMDAVVGNSSSGICEIPALHIPTVDIGDRQKGRLRGNTVIHCEARADAIVAAIRQAYAMDCTQVVNPYGAGISSKRMMTELTNYAANRSKDRPKTFFRVGN
ncbi:UDP-N-acetylglucosamine 2-epimerase [Paenibacillus sp. y28]|uniref:UDP-N-acetylglucosamine 2-epimerase n=1 Tax=Paenibacillus sp. y28 TaxID=3129110 RepID=UPI00301A21D0